MKAVLDACVLYPTVMREILLGVAARGAFTPLWSARILQEWALAVERNFPEQSEGARVEIALLNSRWPDAKVDADPTLDEKLYLPDPNDRHVLASAITGGAEVLVTSNTKDFPTRVLAGKNILRRDPDGFLRDLFEDDPAMVADVCETVRQRAAELSGEACPLRPLLKKARLPRLAKALTAR